MKNKLFQIAISAIILLIVLIINTVSAQTWQTRVSVSGAGSWPSVSMPDANTIIIAGGSTGPAIFRSLDGGTTYTQLSTYGIPTGIFLSAVFALDANTIYVGTGGTDGQIVDNSSVYKTANGGQNWTRVLGTGVGTKGFINGIFFNRTSPQYGYIQSDASIKNAGAYKYWTTVNGGTTWHLDSVTAPNSQAAQNSAFYIDQNFFGFGLTTLDYRAAITTNGGTNWNFYSLTGAQGTTGFVTAIAFASDKLNGIAATSQTQNTVSRTTNGGLTWFSQSIPNTITGIARLRYVPGTPVVYLTVGSSSNSKSYRSTNYGANWAAINYPSGASNIYHFDVQSVVNGSGIFVNATSFSSNGKMYYLTESPLPVELQSFTYSVSDNNVNLKWITTSETNNQGFEIYRSDNNADWKKIGFVNGKGNTNTQTVYNYSDKNLNKGKYTYRLKQIDFNGNYEYFTLAGSVTVEAPHNYLLTQNYPNPFNPSTKISYQLPVDEFVSLKIYDNSGKEVANLVNGIQQAGYHTVEFKSNLSSGVYFYTMKAGSFSETRKMTILK
jgi:photosystem II stability/assembly factor-like uncharacterized protein